MAAGGRPPRLRPFLMLFASAFRHGVPRPSALPLEGGVSWLPPPGSCVRCKSPRHRSRNDTPASAIQSPFTCLIGEGGVEALHPHGQIGLDLPIQREFCEGTVCMSLE